MTTLTTALSWLRPDSAPSGHSTSLATELTAYRRRHIDLSLTASDLCQRMLESVRPTPITDLRSNHDSRTSTHPGFGRHRPVQP